MAEFPQPLRKRGEGQEQDWEIHQFQHRVTSGSRFNESNSLEAEQGIRRFARQMLRTCYFGALKHPQRPSAFWSGIS